ncbi:MAG: metalloregulator ArsR/SmtB family transcription factor [Acidimicrobiales bacterium]
MPRAATTSDLFNAVGDASRRNILGTLARGEASVSELVECLGLAQPHVSRHLKVLREVDVVRCRTAGRRRLYRVHAPGLRPLQSWLTNLTAQVNERYDRLDDHLHELLRDQNDETSTP